MPTAAELHSALWQASVTSREPFSYTWSWISDACSDRTIPTLIFLYPIENCFHTQSRGSGHWNRSHFSRWISWCWTFGPAYWNFALQPHLHCHLTVTLACTSCRNVGSLITVVGIALPPKKKHLKNHYVCSSQSMLDELQNSIPPCQGVPQPSLLYALERNMSRERLSILADRISLMFDFPRKYCIENDSYFLRYFLINILYKI